MPLWGSWGCHTGQPHGLKLRAGLWDLGASSDGLLLPISAFQSLLVPRTRLCKGARADGKSIQKATYPIQITSYIKGIARGQIWRSLDTCSRAYRWWIDCIGRYFFSSSLSFCLSSSCAIFLYALYMEEEIFAVFPFKHVWQNLFDRHMYIGERGRLWQLVKCKRCYSTV